METRTIRSASLGNARTVWLQAPPDGQPPRALCILLDGEYSIERMDLPPVLETEQQEGTLPPLAIAYVSHIDAEIRWPESFCNVDFAAFVAEELLPWARARFSSAPADAPVLLGGLSLTGLSAMHAAMLSPDSFDGVFSQSGSFWWEENRLVEWARDRSFGDLAFRIVCGARETDEDVDHGGGLFQRISQLDSNRAMRDVLLESGHRVSYEEYDGGHELEPWRRDVPRSLRALLHSFGA